MKARVVGWLAVAAAILVGATSTPAAQELMATGTLTTVVRTSDSDSVRLEILTGCGFSLRVLKCVTTPVTTDVTRKRGVARPGDLRPGSIVRVRYRLENQENVALAIEVLPPEGAKR